METEAIAIRREWMRLMGCDDDEIHDCVYRGEVLSVDEEKRNLEAAKRLTDRTEHIHEEE